MTAFPCLPPLESDILKKYDFFQLYVPDGGGNFIMKELFGCFEDSVITNKLLHTDIMEEFGGIETLDLHKFEKWRSIEKSCWINRFYFLVPMARTAWLNGDWKLAQIVVHVIQNFFRQETPPFGKAALKDHWDRVSRRMKEDYNSRSHEEIVKDETDVEYIWYDMQVGQRLICFLYASFFVWNFIGKEEKNELAECLKRHARVIADQESFQAPYQDNHQSLRATALWWALPLLKDDSDYEDIHYRTKQLCEWHIMNEFLPSGMLFENSPSYHAFVVWHSRDFLNLAQMRHEAVPEETIERFTLAGKVLACCGRTDGKSLTVNDSYQYDALPLIESLGSVATKPDFAVVKPGGIAVGKLGESYVSMDVSSFIGEFSHYHGGKNSFVYLRKGIPFFEETGCPSYDHPEFPLCKRSDHHSSLLVDGAGDSHQFGLYGFDGWAELKYDESWQDQPQGRSFTSALTSNVPEWKDVVWKRTLLLTEKSLRIIDSVKAGISHDFTLIFCLAPEVTFSRNGRNCQLTNHGITGYFTIENPDAILSENAIFNCQLSEPRKASQIRAEFKQCRVFECVSVLCFEEVNNDK